MNRFYQGDKCKKCNKEITIKNKSGYCRSCRMLGNKITLGRKMSEKQRLELSNLRKGKKNGMWKGDKVGYNALHGWIKNNHEKPDKCDECKKVTPYDLANKGIYNRNISNWEWLCRKCHMTKDGRLIKFGEYGRTKPWLKKA